MRNRIVRIATRVAILGVAALVLTTCVTTPSATLSGPRTIVLDGEAVVEKDGAEFTCWYCVDFVYGGPTLVEVGFIGSPFYEGLGFILYDGGYSGETTNYSREGIEHRWDWGPNGNDYAFVIQPDGTGLYYDFSSVKAGGSTKASSVYECYQRGTSDDIRSALDWWL